MEADPASGNGHFPSESDAPVPDPVSVIPPEEPSLAAPLVLAVAPDTVPPLEERVRRLEAAMKEMQETRITDRPAQEPPQPLVAVPVATPALELAVQAVPAATAPPAPAPPDVKTPENKRSWLLTDILAEARAIQFMFFDPRYRMSWGGRLFPILLLAAFVLTGWLPIAKIPLVGWLIEKSVELILCFVLFKVLSHESRRYRETAPELPPWLRL